MPPIKAIGYVEELSLLWQLDNQVKLHWWGEGGEQKQLVQEAILHKHDKNVVAITLIWRQEP